MDHCRIVLRALAHFHAYSTIIQRDSEEPLLDLWPFAIEATNFKVLVHTVHLKLNYKYKQNTFPGALVREDAASQRAGVSISDVEEEQAGEQDQCRG